MSAIPPVGGGARPIFRVLKKDLDKEHNANGVEASRRQIA
jgi:hypothetical protein